MGGDNKQAPVKAGEIVSPEKDEKTVQLGGSNGVGRLKISIWYAVMLAIGAGGGAAIGYFKGKADVGSTVGIIAKTNEELRSALTSGEEVMKNANNSLKGSSRLLEEAYKMCNGNL